MSTTGHPHVGDVHTIRITVKDENDAAVPLVGPITFRLRKPGGTTLDVSASLVTNGADGEAEYTTTATDLDRSGTWQVQLKDGDGPWHADVGKFAVLPNLADPA